MKTWMKSLVVAFGGMAFVAACEPGGGSETTQTADGTDGTDGVVADGVDSTDGVSTDVFGVIELEDDPNNSTLDPCDTGSIKSPGADIDAAELTTSAGAGTFLTNCSIANTTSCENDSASTSQAEGTPDASGSEETGTYTSLNGGRMRCDWTGGAAVSSGDEVEVIEIGGTSGTNVEQYRIRLCANQGGNCTRDSIYASGASRFPTADLF